MTTSTTTRPGAAERYTGWAAALLVAAGLAWGLFIAPSDAYQGEVQRIIYLHVPSAWVTFTAFFVVFWFSIRFLRTRNIAHDTTAHAAAAVGTLFCGITLATGSIWGKFAWGVWWTWDARLTTVAVLFLIFSAYLILRSLVDDEGPRARFSAVLGIIGFLDVPVIHMSVYWWRTLHQPASVMRPDGPKMSPDLLYPLLFNSVAFLVLMAHFILARKRMLAAEREAELAQTARLHASEAA